MNRIILIAIFCIGSITISFAQPPRVRAREKIEAAKIAFISQKLDLTPAEAQQFWPIYNTYQKEIQAINKERVQARKEGNDDDLVYSSNVLEVRKRYRKEFMRILPKEKALIVYKAEQEFNTNLRNELLKRLNESNP